MRGLLLALVLLLCLPQLVRAETPLDRWRTMKYGFFVHYVWDGVGGVTRNPDGSAPASIDALCDSFDAQAFADDLASMGVEYLVFTAWHSNMYPLYPSAAIDRVQPGRSPKRDLLGDVLDAVKAKGLRVFFYTHPEQPVFGMPNAEWNDFLKELYGELVDRYGSRLDGLYLDENSIWGDMNLREDFPRLERTIRSRQPHLLLMQNFYGNMYVADVGVAEYNSFQPKDPLTWGVGSYQGVAHVMSRTWAAQVPLGTLATPFTPEGIFRFTVLQAATNLDGGGVFWAAGPYAGGGWESGILTTMQQVGAYLAPISASIKHTLASLSWPTPTGTAMSSLAWGVATRAPDDNLEYVHVLKPQLGTALHLPPPADGKIFDSARLLSSGKPVGFNQDVAGVHLLLPPGTDWDPLDTVIELTTRCQGGPGLVNNTSSAFAYTGNSWVHLPDRGLGEFQNDVHEATADGDGFSLAFNGTEVELLASGSGIQCQLGLYLDGSLLEPVEVPAGAPPRQVVFGRTGLARGAHELRGVKLGGGSLLVDAARVVEFVPGDDSSLVASGLVETLNDTDPRLTYSGPSWAYQPNRDQGELGADIHYATHNGDFFTLAFTGSGVEFLSNAGENRAVIDFYLDGVYRATVDMRAGQGSRQRMFSLLGLPTGPHVLKGVKTYGTWMEIDMFRVYEPAPDAKGPGSYVELSFTGTGVALIAPRSPDQGTLELYLDGALVRRANHYSSASLPEAATFQLAGLAFGQHVLTVVNKTGDVLAVSAFRVYK